MIVTFFGIINYEFKQAYDMILASLSLNIGIPQYFEYDSSKNVGLNTPSKS